MSRHLIVVENESVVTGSSRNRSRETSHGIVLGPVLDRSEFTVISRNFCGCFQHNTPDVEVPNLPVDVDSWGR